MWERKGNHRVMEIFRVLLEGEGLIILGRGGAMVGYSLWDMERKSQGEGDIACSAGGGYWVRRRYGVIVIVYHTCGYSYRGRHGTKYWRLSLWFFLIEPGGLFVAAYRKISGVQPRYDLSSPSDRQVCFYIATVMKELTSVHHVTNSRFLNNLE